MSIRRFLLPLFIFALAGTPPSGAAPSEATPALELEPCQVSGVLDARCGSLTVPENPEDPEARTIDLRIVLLEATGEAPVDDPIVYLSGGPGTAATATAPGFARSSLRAERDLIFVDQRGTGGSNPLRCDLGDFADGLRVLMTFDFGEAAARCAEDLSTRADLRTYTTHYIVDDLEAVRRALGIDRWNLVGGSYGTRVALEYLRRYPDHSRTAVLRGVAGPEISIPLGFARSSHDALREVSRDCSADEGCGPRFPELEASVRRLRDRLDAAPVTVPVVDPTTGRSLELKVGGDELAAIVHYSLYSEQLAAGIPGFIAAAENGNLRPAVGSLAALASQLLPQFHFGSFLSVVCAEDAPFFDERDVAQAAEGTMIGGDFGRGLLSSCRNWPSLAVDEAFKTLVRSDVPVLLVSGSADPVTPPADAESAQKGLSRSLHLVLPGVGHFGFFPGCSGRLVGQFLDQGDVDGLEPSCVADLERPPFGRI